MRRHDPARRGERPWAARERAGYLRRVRHGHRAGRDPIQALHLTPDDGRKHNGKGSEGLNSRHEAAPEDGTEGQEVDRQAHEHGAPAMTKIEVILWALVVVWGWDLVKAIWRDWREVTGHWDISGGTPRKGRT